MNDFGSTLRRLRQERGMSLTQMATLVRYSKGYLSKLESGARPATTAIARAFDTALEANGQLLTAFGRCEDGFRSGTDDYVEQLETIFTTVRSMGHSMSPELVLPMLLANIETAGAVLRSAGPGDTTKLVLLIARIKEYAGWMAQEAGQLDLAMRLTEEAARMAVATGNHELSQFALIRFADIALYQGDGLKIVELTRRTLDWPGIALRTRSIAWQRQAQGHALLGDRSSCMHALDHALAFHEADQAELGAQVLGTTSVTRPVEMTKGWALVDLCFHEEAAMVLRKVIAELPAESVRSRVRFTARLALACASSGDVERACELVWAALPDINRVDSDTVRVDLRALAEVLRRRRSRGIPVDDLLSELQPQLGGSARRG